MSIWTRLKKAKTVPDLEAQRADLANVITGSEAELTRLRASLTTGAFEAGDKFDPRAIGASIREAGDELTALRAVATALDTELAAARQREADAALDRVLARRAPIAAKMTDALKSFHAAALALTAARDSYRAAAGELEALNNEARAAGRPGVAGPLAVLAKTLAPRPQVDPFAGLFVQDYLPQPHPDCPQLAKLT